MRADSRLASRASNTSIELRTVINRRSRLASDSALRGASYPEQPSEVFSKSSKISRTRMTIPGRGYPRPGLPGMRPT